MKAVRIHEYGDLDTLRFEDAPVPEPAQDRAKGKIVLDVASSLDEEKNP